MKDATYRDLVNIFKSWQVCDWLAKWMIMLRFMDLRWPRVFRRSNVGLVIIIIINIIIDIILLYDLCEYRSSLTYIEIAPWMLSHCLYCYVISTLSPTRRGHQTDSLVVTGSVECHPYLYVEYINMIASIGDRKSPWGISIQWWHINCKAIGIFPFGFAKCMYSCLKKLK